MRNYIFDMSGVLSEEGFEPEGAGRFDFRGLDGTGCYCDAEAASDILNAVLAAGIGGIHWIDTGDYHYISKFFLDLVGEPFQLLLLDHHSDRQESAFGGILSCGSWVTEALRANPNLKSVISIGPDHSFTEPDADLPLYISIDLDVLSPEEFSTNWDQGSMSFAELEETLGEFASGRRILGVDVCGGLTIEKGATASSLSGNLSLRRRLLALFNRIL